MLASDIMRIIDVEVRESIIKVSEMSKKKQSVLSFNPSFSKLPMIWLSPLT